MRACIPDAESLRMPSCVPVLDFVPDRLRVFGALSAVSPLGGSGSWLDSADSLDMSSALVFPRDGSELEVSTCSIVAGVRGFAGCDSLGRSRVSSVGDGRGDGRCAVLAAVAVTVAADMSIASGFLQCLLASDSITPPLKAPSLDICDCPSRPDASASGACKARSSEMPRPAPFSFLTDPSSISHYDRNWQSGRAIAKPRAVNITPPENDRRSDGCCAITRVLAA